MPFRIIVILITAIVGAITAAIYPFIGLLQLVFLVFGRPQDDRPNVEPLHIPLMITVAILVGMVFRAGVSLPAVVSGVKRLWIMFVLYILIALSTFNNWTVLSKGSLDEFTTLILFCVLSIALVDSEKRLREYMLALLGSGTYIVLRAISSGSHIHEEIGGEHFDRLAIAKGDTVFGNSNYLALFMAITIFLAITLIGYYRKSWQRLAILAIVGGATYVFFNANSRGASLALATGVILHWLMSKRKLKTAAIIAVLVAVGSLFAPVTYWDRLGTITHYQEDASATNRLELWNIAMDLIPSHPILGVGPNNFIFYAPNSPHNAYLQIASEVGVPALLVYVAWLLAGLYSTLRTKKLCARLGPEGDYFAASAQGIFCCVVVVIVQGFTTGLAHREVVYVFVTLGICVLGFAERATVRLEASRVGDTNYLEDHVKLPAGVGQPSPWQS